MHVMFIFTPDYLVSLYCVYVHGDLVPALVVCFVLGLYSMVLIVLFFDTLCFSLCFVRTV